MADRQYSPAELSAMRERMRIKLHAYADRREQLIDGGMPRPEASRQALDEINAQYPSTAIGNG